MGATATESYIASNISADTDAFGLRGGLYGVLMVATWGGGSVTLEGLAPDGTTWVTVLTAFTANAYATVSLPPGQYRLNLATATALYAAVARIPE